MAGAVMRYVLAVLAALVCGSARADVLNFGPGCPLSGCTYTGEVTFTGIQFLNSVNHSGSLAASTTGIFNQQFFFGASSASNDALQYFGISDNVDYSGSTALNGLGIFLVPGGGTTAGNRNAILGQVGISSAANQGDPSARNYTGVEGIGFATVNNGGTTTAISPTTFAGGMFGGVSFGRLTGAATAWQGLYAHEFDYKMDAGSSAAVGAGLNIVQQTGHRTRGIYTDAAISLNAQDDASNPGWLSLIEFGGATVQAPSASDSTLIKAQPRLYGTSPGKVPFLNGVDLRGGSIASGGAAFLSPNFAADLIGAVYANGVTTNGTVQAQTATLTGTTIADGGVYLAVPTFTVDAPPSGGSTATAVVATMGGTSIVGFGATGSGYSVSDVLTVAGGTGGAPTFTVSSVNGTGGITGITLTSAGTLTSAPANPATTTGGGGTGALLNVVYTQSGSQFRAASATFAATGAGFVNADTLTIASDTGTAATFTVASVTAQGGIKTMTLAGAGSLTAIAAGTYHTATGGTGTGASLQVGYKVLTLTLGAGSGYVPKPAPLILSSTSAYKVANIRATMTAAAATLNLQPSGGNTLIGSGSALATNATSGMLLIPSMAGTPSGNVGALGGVALNYDSTNKKLCVTIGATVECSAAMTP